MEKMIADLAFTLGCYIYHTIHAFPAADLDDQIDLVMDDMGGPEDMKLRVRAQIIKGYQSADTLGRQLKVLPTLN